jgi:predicted GIY-YIG superfamily endonuclease
MAQSKGTVYLIHFHRKLCHAQHYLGFAENLEDRVEKHKNGTGARLMEVITEAGIGWEVVRTWAGGRRLERKLKNQKKAPRLCPLCRAASMVCRKKQNVA